MLRSVKNPPAFLHNVNVTTSLVGHLFYEFSFLVLQIRLLLSYMMPLLLQEIILLDLLKVISHHGARLATPIRSVQRVLDESESRSSPFRDMRNANQNQRRPYLLLDSQVAASSDDDEDDESDVSEDIVRLSAQLAKAAKARPMKDIDSESEGSMEEQSGPKAPSDVNKPKDIAPVADENSRTPVTAPQHANSSSDASPLQETVDADDSDVHQTLMDRIHAGTEETLVRSHADTALLQNQSENGKPFLPQAVPTSHIPTPEIVVELPEEKVPHLYSNNVGLDDPTVAAAEPASPASSADEGSEKEATTMIPSLKVNVDVQSHHLGDQDVTKAASHTTNTDVKVNDQHVGVHVAVASTLSVDDDPWKQPPSDPKTDENNSFSDDSALAGAAAASPASSDDHDPWRQPSTHAGNEMSVASSNDPWTQPSPITQVQHQPSRPTVDPNLIPGVAIDGPKHTLPLDQDEITLDDSPTLVALGKSNSSKERRDSAGHGGGKGAAASDASSRDRER